MSRTGPCEEVLDEPTRKKLKEHNRSIYQQKKQEAIALRQKLEQWKEEKRQKKMHVQKKAPFLTTALKPVPVKPQEKACTTLPKTRKSVCGPGKPVCGPVKPVCGPVKPVCRPVKPVCGPTKPVCGPAKSQSNVRQPITHKPVCGPTKNLANVAQIKESKKPCKKDAKCQDRPDSSLLSSDHQNRAGKENEVVTRSKTPSTSRKNMQLSKAKGSPSSSSVSDCSKLSASEMTTPLSRSSGFGMRHAITSLVGRVEEGQEVFRPPSLADELHAASCATEVIAAENVTESTDNDGCMQTWEEGKVAVFVGCSTVKPTNKADVASAPAPVKTRKTPRDSLTAQFHKSKSQNKAAKKNPVPAPVTKKVSSLTSIRPAKPTVVSNRPRSILKQRSCGSSFRPSALGASPLLPAASSSKTERKTAGADTTARKGANCEKIFVEGLQGAAGLTGHVKFAVEMGKADGEGASFRKTPGKCKSQEYMRLKLNDWLATKGRTPSSMRHTGCFGCEAQASRLRTPRSQVKASMSVEQLSRQESTLAKEDTRITPRHFPSASTPPPPFRLSLTPHHTSWHNTVTQPSPRLASVGCNSKTKAMSKSENGDESLEVVHQGVEANKSEGMGAEDYWSEDEGTEGDSMEVEASPSSGRAVFGLQTDSTDQLDKDLEKCLASINSGSLSAEAALKWLDLVSEACHEVRRQVCWYKCKVAALKITADEDALLAVFEQAIIHNAQPAAEMAQLLTDTMKELLSTRGRAKHGRRSTTSRPSAGSVKRLHPDQRASHQPEVQVENMFQSTTVKYSVVEVTPFKKRRRTTDTEETLIPVITPVRRSARFSSARTAPASEGRLPQGTPRVVEYSAIGEVPSEEREHMLFQPNRALEPLLRDESPETKRLSLDEAL